MLTTRAHARTRRVAAQTMLLFTAAAAPVHGQLPPPTRELSQSVAPSAACRVGTPPITLGPQYNLAAKRGFVANFKATAIDELYEAVRRAHAHYAYVGFMESYPNAPQRSQIECLLREFAMFTPTSATELTFIALKEKYNFDGRKSMHAWNGETLAGVQGTVIGSATIGNLQFLDTAVIGVTPTGLSISAGTRFIYPLTRPPQLPFTTGALSGQWRLSFPKDGTQFGFGVAIIAAQKSEWHLIPKDVNTRRCTGPIVFKQVDRVQVVMELRPGQYSTHCKTSTAVLKVIDANNLEGLLDAGVAVRLARQ